MSAYTETMTGNAPVNGVNIKKNILNAPANHSVESPENLPEGAI